jgi:hypothetical protein
VHVSTQSDKCNTIAERHCDSGKCQSKVDFMHDNNSSLSTYDKFKNIRIDIDK